MERLKQVSKISSCFPLFFTGKAHLIAYPQIPFGQVSNECRILIISSWTKGLPRKYITSTNFLNGELKYYTINGIYSVNKYFHEWGRNGGKVRGSIGDEGTPSLASTRVPYLLIPILGCSQYEWKLSPGQLWRVVPCISILGPQTLGPALAESMLTTQRGLELWSPFSGICSL